MHDWVYIHKHKVRMDPLRQLYYTDRYRQCWGEKWIKLYLQPYELLIKYFRVIAATGGCAESGAGLRSCSHAKTVFQKQVFPVNMVQLLELFSSTRKHKCSNNYGITITLYMAM